MEIKLCKSTAKRTYVKKKPTTLKKVNADFLENSSVINPRLRVRYSAIKPHLKECNYLKIEDFGRYYFIDDIIVTDSQSVILQCSVDVLKTYENEILQQKCYIERQQNRGNYDIIDDKLIYKQRHKIGTTKITGCPFSRDNISQSSYSIALTVNGGN